MDLGQALALVYKQLTSTISWHIQRLWCVAEQFSSHLTVTVLCKWKLLQRAESLVTSKCLQKQSDYLRNEKRSLNFP